MRLSDYEARTIKHTLEEHFGHNCSVILFGSRVDDNARGGDIDLLVQADLNAEHFFRKKIEALSELQLKLGDRKIDLVTYQPGNDREMPTIISEALQNGVKL